MFRRFITVLFTFAFLLSACDALISNVLEGVEKVIETNPPHVIIIHEVITTERVVITATPEPTATITPVPAFMGAPFQPDPAFMRAVEVSVAALGTGFQVRLFTRSANGEVIVWVRDVNFPETLLCGAPLYFPGLGSLLVLTSSNFYASANQYHTFSATSGCIAVSLAKGKEQVKKLLENYQGIYDAAEARQKFSSGDGVKNYITSFLTRNQGKPYQNELNLVLVALTGNDFKRTSINLDFSGKTRESFFQYLFTGAPMTDEKSGTRSVPLAYARYFEQNVGATEFFLLGPHGQKIQQAALSTTAKLSPLTVQEVIAAWFSQNSWEQLVFSGAFTVGLGTIYPGMNTEIKHTNPAFSYLSPFTGASHTDDAAISQSWKTIQDYLDGLTVQLSASTTSAYIQLMRNNLKMSYLDFIVFEQK